LADRIAWYLVAAMFLFLSVEELVGLHERVSQSAGGVKIMDNLLGPMAAPLRDILGHGFRYSWLVFYAPLILSASGFLFWFFVSHFRSQPGLRRTFIIAVGFYIAAIACEALAKPLRDHLTLLNALVVLEETFEMTGSSVFALGFLSYLNEILARIIQAGHSRFAQ
jgi:hypothetical protein